MSTTGIRRRPAEVRIRPFPSIPLPDGTNFFPLADYVVNTLPLTAETRNLVDADAIARMKPGAFFVNIGRGATVDEDALIAALQVRRSGWSRTRRVPGGTVAP